jgi:hypothetical protein
MGRCERKEYIAAAARDLTALRHGWSDPAPSQSHGSAANLAALRDSRRDPAPS